MSQESQSVWYRLGHAWEQARLPGPPTADRRPRTLSFSRDQRRNGGSDSSDRSLLSHLESAVVAGSGSVVAKVLGRDGDSSDSPVGFFVRAALAGAGAAVLARSLRPLLRGGEPLTLDDTETLVENVLVGVGEGLALGSVASYLPRGRLSRGAIYGVAGYVAAPWGGLTHVLRSAKVAKAPLLAALVSDSDVGERTFLEHVAFGVAFSLLYRSRPASRGTVEVE